MAAAACRTVDLPSAAPDGTVPTAPADHDRPLPRQPCLLVARIVVRERLPFSAAGFGNAYMVATSTEAAVTWNDVSVNENMHAATAFRFMQQEGHGFLGHLAREEWRFLRRTMIAVVLATDMASHSEVVADFSGASRPAALLSLLSPLPRFLRLHQDAPATASEPGPPLPSP